MMTDKLQLPSEQAAAFADRIGVIQDFWTEHRSFEDREALSETAAALRAYVTMATSPDPVPALRLAFALGENCLRGVLEKLPDHPPILNRQLRRSRRVPPRRLTARSTL